MLISQKLLILNGMKNVDERQFRKTRKIRKTRKMDENSASIYACKPKTQRAFADQYGVSEDTLSIWKRLPDFADEVAKLARELVKDDVPEVLATIRSHAKACSIQHINLFLAMAGFTNDVANAHSQRVVTEKDLSDDELLRIATTSRE